SWQQGDTHGNIDFFPRAAQSARLTGRHPLAAEQLAQFSLRFLNIPRRNERYVPAENIFSLVAENRRKGRVDEGGAAVEITKRIPTVRYQDFAWGTGIAVCSGRTACRKIPYIGVPDNEQMVDRKKDTVYLLYESLIIMLMREGSL
ncbi:MAG TPA: hypothetical protein PKV86_01895, partial [Syntrophobacteraceae bacterium]|nr:hypothetical protein [Syntrophobacteraceae bacterium]